MKNFFKTIVAFNLGLIARAVVKRYHPRIVMVTGSVGKTSTKDAVAAALSARFLVRKSEKSFNSEFGVPFTILGVGSPWRNPLAWLSLMKSAFALLVLPNHYPNLIVLEVGADKPGDLARILKIATPDMVIVTRLPEISVHVEAYASPEAVREEEFSPAFALPADAPLIIPSDDEYAQENALRTPARIISYGMTPNANARLDEVSFYSREEKIAGMSGEINVNGEHSRVYVNGSVGSVQLLPVSAAVAAATSFGISFAEAVEALKEYEPPAGRGRILAGKNNSVIIDDSYNASPVAVEKALATLKSLPCTGRRIAVLGDMLELGRYSIIEHERIAKIIGDAVEVIVTVGIRARVFATAPKNVNVLMYDNSRSAAEALPSLISDGDIILVKGSQSIRTERIVEKLLANHNDASRLVRQEKKWKQK